MKISLLEKRENFKLVLKLSLEKFCFEYFGERVCVNLNKKGDLNFRVNSRLNIIFPDKMAVSDRKHFINEYRYSSSLLKRCLQELYCTCSEKKSFNYILNPILFSIQNSLTEMQNWVILPGNNSIRIVNVEKNESYVLIKEGFDSSFMYNDIRIRMLYKCIITPSLKKHSPDYSWYVESRICGLALNRISCERQRKISFLSACENLIKLKEKSKSTVSAFLYLDQLIAKLDKLIDGLPRSFQGLDYLDRNFKKSIIQLSKKSTDTSLELCETHGDFQDANILFDGKNTWIIDWEYSRRRSTFYDYITYSCATRGGGELYVRLYKKLKTCVKDGGLKFWGTLQKGDASLLFSIFIVEDLISRIQETLSGFNHKKDKNFSVYIVEIQKFLESISLDDVRHVQN